MLNKYYIDLDSVLYYHKDKDIIKYLRALIPDQTAEVHITISRRANAILLNNYRDTIFEEALIALWDTVHMHVYGYFACVRRLASLCVLIPWEMGMELTTALCEIPSSTDTIMKLIQEWAEIREKGKLSILMFDKGVIKLHNNNETGN